MNWAIVLAAGEGSRLKRMTRDRNGTAVPKQFCSLTGGESLLEQTVARAATMVPYECVVSIVAAQHRSWWDPLLRLREENVVVQPKNRGTAIGILLPALEILRRDPDAKVVVLPSDHYVRSEEPIAAAVCGAFSRLRDAPRDTILLGITPSRADPELGYITHRPSAGGVHAVESIVEKPKAGVARRLIETGALWSTFITVARAESLVALVEQTVPGAPGMMREALGARDRDAALASLYRSLPTVDFSGDVLEGSIDQLKVIPVPNCGWSDLGTPSRVLACLEKLHDEAARPPQPAARVWVNLAEARTRLPATASGRRGDAVA